MVEHLGYPEGEACVAYDDGIEGQLTVKGFRLDYNDFTDLRKAACFMVAGVAGDYLNNNIPNGENAFSYLISHYSNEIDKKEVTIQVPTANSRPFSRL